MRRILFLSAIDVLLLSLIVHAGWSQPVRIWPGGAQWPQIIAQGDTIHVTAVHITNNVDKIAYIRSIDCGNTWGQLHILSGDSCSVFSPRIICDGQHLMVLWKTVFDVGYRRFNIGYSVSSNNGRTWSTARYIFNPNLLGGQYFAASGNYLAVNIIFNERVGDSLVFSIVRSTNFGQSWSNSQEIFAGSQSGPPDEVGFGDLFHFIWGGCFNPNDMWETYYIRSTDRGLSWSNNLRISDMDGFGSYLPAICVNESGLPSVSWVDFKHSPYWFTGDIFTKQSPDSGLSWSNEAQVSFNHFATISDISKSADTLHIVWQDESNGPGHINIYYAKSTDNGVSWREPYWIDGTLDDSWDPTLGVSNGRVYVVWADARWEPDSIQGGLYISRFDPEPDAINEEINNLPAIMALSAYPNPFNSSVTIRYSNFKGGGINIYDVQGKLIKSLDIKGGENGKIIWDACDASGKKVASGIYFARAETSLNPAELKLLYLK